VPVLAIPVNLNGSSQGSFPNCAWMLQRVVNISLACILNMLRVMLDRGAFRFEGEATHELWPVAELFLK
jgi:hypothetical protein